MDLCALIVLQLRMSDVSGVHADYSTNGGQDLLSVVNAVNCFTPSGDFQWGNISAVNLLCLLMKKWFTGGQMYS